METVQTESLATAGKNLTFSLADEHYGLEILRVQELVGLLPVTRVPRLPAFVAGVVNLRGRVIPLVDLRLCFGMPASAMNDRTCVIIVRVEREQNRSAAMGVIVDEVAEVISLKDEQIEPAPSFGTTVDTDFILGMGKANQKVIMLLDIDQVLTHEQISAVERTDAEG